MQVRDIRSPLTRHNAHGAVEGGSLQTYILEQQQAIGKPFVNGMICGLRDDGKGRKEAAAFVSWMKDILHAFHYLHLQKPQPIFHGHFSPRNALRASPSSPPSCHGWMLVWAPLTE